MNSVSEQIKEYSLNIHLIGINIDPELLKGNEVIVDVSTRPENFKDSFSVSADKLKNLNRILVINVKVPTEQTNKIINEQTELIMFSIKIKDKLQIEKKIGITRLLPHDLPKVTKDQQNLTIYDNIKKIKIYKTSKNQKKEFYIAQEKGFVNDHQISDHNTIKREEIGKMEIQLSLCDPYINTKQRTTKVRSQNNQKNLKSAESEFRFLKSKDSHKFKNRSKCQYEKFN